MSWANVIQNSKLKHSKDGTIAEREAKMEKLRQKFKKDNEVKNEQNNDRT